MLLNQAVGAQSALTRHEFTEIHMGMPVRMVLYAATDSAARGAARSAFRRVAELDNTFSDYRAQSEVRRLASRSGDWVEVSQELFEVLSLSIEIARATDGAFDPTAAPVIALWREARRTKAVPSPRRVDSARAVVGWKRIALDSSRRAARLERGTSLDLGGIAKGYILGQARAALRTAGVRAMLIEAGGDVVVGGAPSGSAGWRIDAPGASPEMATRLEKITNAAVSTSGGSVQFVEIDGTRYSHVVDPRTGIALTTRQLVRVIGRDPAVTDAIATAVGVLGKTIVFPGVEMIHIGVDRPPA